MSEVSELRDELREFREMVIGLKKHRWWITVATAALTVVVALAVAWVVFVSNPRIDKNASTGRAAATKAQAAIDAATATKARQAALELARCESGNDFRRADRARWQFIIDLTPPPTTLEDREIRARFVKFINEADALRDCSSLR